MPQRNKKIRNKKLKIRKQVSFISNSSRKSPSFLIFNFLFLISYLFLRMASHYHKILIITAPSGAGKTSITHNLMQHFPQLAFSVSAATRQARANERHG